MGDKILITVFLVVGSGIIIYAVLGQFFKLPHPKYVKGGKLGLIGELAIGVFTLSCGLIILHSPIWILPAIAAFAVGFAHQTISERKFLAKERDLRKKNAVNYPGIFDTPPPLDIESINEDKVDLFDTGSCIYLGRVSKDDVKELINQTKDIPEQGPNDIYMLVESLELLPNGSVSPEFIELLQKAFDKRDYLEIRWMPPKSYESEN